VRAGNDTLLGGDGNDQLVGDNLVQVAEAIPGPTAPGVYGLTTVVDDLSVNGGNDNLDGQAGDDLKDSGNQVLAPRELVKRSWVSQASRTAPVIEWSSKACLDATGSDRPTWVSDFVNGLGQTGNPNGKIRVKL
jgi:hypothetical protein